VEFSFLSVFMCYFFVSSKTVSLSDQPLGTKRINWRSSSIIITLKPTRRNEATRIYLVVGFLCIGWLSVWGSRQALMGAKSMVPTYFEVATLEQESPSMTAAQNSTNRHQDIVSSTDEQVHSMEKQDDGAIHHLQELGIATKCQDTSPFFNEHFRAVPDHLSPLWWQSLHGGNEAGVPATSFWSRKLLIVIGDSLDRKMTDHTCLLLRGNKTKEEPQRKFAHPFVCVSTTITFVYLNIFGMDAACPNSGALRAVDTRFDYSTAKRIASLLPVLLGLLPPHYPPSDAFVQVGSNMWDLSQGCNDHLGIDEQYAMKYRQGLRNVHNALRDTLRSYYPSSKGWILWKIAPPISLRLSEERMKAGTIGAVRINQDALNMILKDEVAVNTGTTGGQLKLGDGIVDFWNHVNVLSLPDDVLDREFERDGYHFARCGSLAFFNLLLDVIWRMNL
jgi:hypothetical protein